jgi:hypothetical protein
MLHWLQQQGAHTLSLPAFFTSLQIAMVRFNQALFLVSLLTYVCCREASYFFSFGCFFREYKFWLLVLVDLVVSLNFPSYLFLFVFLVDFAVDTAAYLTFVWPVSCECYSSRYWFYQPVYDAFVYLAHYLLVSSTYSMPFSSCTTPHRLWIQMNDFIWFVVHANCVWSRN